MSLDRALTVAESFGGGYVESDTRASPITLALHGRRAPARDAGAPDGTGSHRIVIGGDAEPFTDLDRFTWQTTAR